MSLLANTQQRLLETAALIAREERALVAHPDQSRSIIASIRSLEKMRKQLEIEYDAAASRLGLDICKYRLFSDEGTYRLPSVGPALLDFQQLVTTVYDALKTGPKQRARTGIESLRESSFELAYTFVGSLGFALTLPNERMLFDEIRSLVDDSISAVCEMAVVQDSASIAGYARKYGNATIRAMRKWADWHVRSGLGAEIQWERNRKPRAGLLIQYEELQHLQKTIDNTSDEQIASIELVGTLTKVDVRHKRFSLEVEDAEKPIEGKFSDAINESHEAMVPHRYRVFLVKTTRTMFAYEEDEETYFLERIETLR